MKCECKPRKLHRVVIEKPAGTPDAAGHVDLSDDTNWQQVGSRAASFLSRGGSEGQVFNQVQATVTHVVELQSDSLTRSILPSWRLRMGARKFNITAAYDVDEMRRDVRVEVVEVK